MHTTRSEVLVMDDNWDINIRLIRRYLDILDWSRVVFFVNQNNL